MKKILIIGATSAIAEATAKLWAAEGHVFYLIARNKPRLKAISNDLLVRGAKSVRSFSLDINEFSKHEQLIDAAFEYLNSQLDREIQEVLTSDESCREQLKGIDIVLIAHGSLGNQKACEQQFDETLLELNTNCISVISLLTYLANRMQAQGHGTIAVISSVAADRARASNYVYATAKAAIDTFCSGLRSRLSPHGVHLLLIKPGFIATPMTAHLDFPKLLIAQPERVAEDIRRAEFKRKDTVYTPWFWAWIMFVVRHLPKWVFNTRSSGF